MLEANTVEVNIIRGGSPTQNAGLKEGQPSLRPVERFFLLLGVVLLSALAGGMAAWVVAKLI